MLKKKNENVKIYLQYYHTYKYLHAHADLLVTKLVRKQYQNQTINRYLFKRVGKQQQSISFLNNIFNVISHQKF